MIITGALAWSLLVPAFALETLSKAPGAPLCGKTVEECQKAFDVQGTALRRVVSWYNGAVQQRNQAQNSLLDSQLQSYIDQQSNNSK